GDAELVVNLAQIILHHLFGGAYAQGNFLVLHALGYAGNDQGLFGRELNFRTASSRAAGLVAECAQDPANTLPVQPGLAMRDFAQALDEGFRLHFAGNDSVRTAAEQFQRQLLVGLVRHDHQFHLWRLAQEVGNGLQRIRCDGGFENQNVGREFFGGRQGLGQSFGLTDYANVVSQSKNLAQAYAKNGLSIGNDDANELTVAATLVRLVQIVCHADRNACHLFPCSALPALKSILVDDHAHTSPATVFETAHHASPAVDPHVFG